MFTIMLVDDQPAILAGLKALVEGTGLAQVIASESDPEHVIRVAEAQQPDLVLLDVSLGTVSGIDVARQLNASCPETRVLAVSAHPNSVYVRGMLNAGARGYMLKDNGPREIGPAIEAVMQGGEWIGEGVSAD